MIDLTETTAIEKEMSELAKEPEIEIVLSDDKDDGAKDEDPREALTQLKKQFEEQRRLADQERQARIQWEQQAYRMNHVAYLEAADNAKKEYATLREQLAAALERADSKEAADLQLRAVDLSRRLDELNDGVQRTKNAPPAPVDPRAQQDAWLAQQSPANASWIREHRDRFFNDPQFAQKAVAASQYATAVLNIEPGTQEYYDHINQAVEKTNGHASGAQRTESRRSPSPTVAAAPPSRYTPGVGAPNPSRITLTREQRDHARALYADSKDPDTAYARRILADYRAGLCDANGRYFQK